jgi:hypothetical protein
MSSISELKNRELLKACVFNKFDEICKIENDVGDTLDHVFRNCSVSTIKKYVQHINSPEVCLDKLENGARHRIYRENAKILIDLLQSHQNEVLKILFYKQYGIELFKYAVLTSYRDTLQPTLEILEYAFCYRDFDLIKYVAEKLPPIDVNNAFKKYIKMTSDAKIVEYMVTKSDLTVDDIDFKILHSCDIELIEYITKKFGIPDPHLKKVLQIACYNANLNVVTYLAKNFTLTREHLRSLKNQNFRFWSTQCSRRNIMPIINVLINNIQ